MIGVKNTIITDDEAVKMHTNFADFKNAFLTMNYKDMATWSKENGVLKVHTNTLHGWIYVFCKIAQGLLKAGQKYGISLRSSNHNLSISLQNGSATNVSKVIVAPHWDGDKISSVCMPKEEDVNVVGIYAYIRQSNADYELRDFRIWEIDE